MNRSKNGTYTTIGLSTEIHKSFQMPFGLSVGGGMFIARYLFYTKYNEIKYFIQFCTKACFVYIVTQKISDILWIILEILYDTI